MKKFIKSLIYRLHKTVEESITDPDIVVAVTIPTKTKFGLACKITYILSQILENFKKHNA